MRMAENEVVRLFVKIKEGEKDQKRDTIENDMKAVGMRRKDVENPDK